MTTASAALTSRHQSWVWRIAVAVAVSLCVWHVATAAPIRTADLRLRVLREVVPRKEPAPDTSYLSGVLHALGLKDLGVAPVSDATWFDGAVRRATAAPQPGHILAAYALLTNPPQAETARRLLAEDRGSDPLLVTLWMGRAAWTSGDRAGAAHDWEKAFGQGLALRTRLAEALYIKGEIALAIDEVVELLYLPDTADLQRTEVFDLIRNWMFWQGGSEDGVLQLCGRVLRPTWEGWSDHLSDPRTADIWARRALAEFALGRPQEADLSFARAESMKATPYLQAARAARALAQGHTEEAQRVALESVAEAGRDGHALLLAARVLWDLGRQDDAIRAWRLVLERVPALASEAQAQLDLAAAARRGAGR